MTDVKISQLPTASTPISAADVLVLNQGGVTKKTTVGSILAGGFQIVNTISDLKNLAVSAGAQVYCAGYYAIGDGGGGFFYGATSGGPYTDNGGTVIIPTLGTSAAAWLRVYETDINVRWFGARAAPGFDNAPAFTAARTVADTNNGALYVPGGTYEFDTCLTSAENLIIYGDGFDTVLDFSGAIGDYGLEALGAATQIEYPSVATEGIRTVTFGSAPALSVNDVFVVYNSNDYSWMPSSLSGGARFYYRAGEWCEVMSISGSTANVRVPLYATYVAGPTVKAYKITGPKVHIRNIAIHAANTTVVGLIHVQLCRDAIIENVELQVKGAIAGNGVSACFMDRCYNATVKDIVASNLYPTNDDVYGLSIANSQHVRVFGGKFESARHGVTFGGGDWVCSVPCRDIRVIGADIRSGGTVADAPVCCADMHGDTEDCSYIDCTIYGGAQFGGMNNTYENCKIWNRPDGVIVLFSETKGGLMQIKGCNLLSFADPNASARGYISAAAADTSLGAFTDVDLTIKVSDCSFYARNENANPQFLRMEIDGTTVKTNVYIDGLVGDIPKMYTILYTGSLSGTPNADFMVIDRVSNFNTPSGANTGVYLHETSTAYYTSTSVKHRCQKQTGSEDLATSASVAYTEGTEVGFQYIYPRIPCASTASARADGVAALFIGTMPALAITEKLTADKIQPAIIASDSAMNWGAAVTFKTNWTVSLDEV